MGVKGGVKGGVKRFRAGRYYLTEVSEVKMEVKMGVNSLRSWELKRTLHC